jgi:competence ComEA-like helix-hairpin-helix protein
MLCRTHSLSLSHLFLAAVSLTLVLEATACVKPERNQRVAVRQPTSNQQSIAPIANNQQPRRININSAPASELETLPGIGKALAARIVEHRDKYGPFRRPEHLIIVRGISDRHFRALRELITVE